MEEKTGTAGAGPHAGCFFCATALPLLEKCWSEATREHFHNSRVEFLKGIRSLLDDRIAHMSKEARKGTRVTVE
jgi:hypothetical protein